MIVVDASLAVKLFLNEPDSAPVRRRWQQWTDSGEMLIAPALFRAETVSVLRRSVHRGLLAEPDGDHAVGVLEHLTVEIREPPGLYRVAWELAKRFNRPTVHDCCYLALAAMVGCDFWTADQRLANAIGASLSWVHTP